MGNSKLNGAAKWGAVALTAILAMFGGIAWAASNGAKIGNNERQIRSVKRELGHINDKLDDLLVGLARVEERIK